MRISLILTLFITFLPNFVSPKYAFADDSSMVPTCPTKVARDEERLRTFKVFIFEDSVLEEDKIACLMSIKRELFNGESVNRAGQLLANTYYDLIVNYMRYAINSYGKPNLLVTDELSKDFTSLSMLHLEDFETMFLLVSRYSLTGENENNVEILNENFLNFVIETNKQLDKILPLNNEHLYRVGIGLNVRISSEFMKMANYQLAIAWMKNAKKMANDLATKSPKYSLWSAKLDEIKSVCNDNKNCDRFEVSYANDILIGLVEFGAHKTVKSQVHFSDALANKEKSSGQWEAAAKHFEFSADLIERSGKADDIVYYLSAKVGAANSRAMLRHYDLVEKHSQDILEHSTEDTKWDANTSLRSLAYGFISEGALWQGKFEKAFEFADLACKANESLPKDTGNFNLRSRFDIGNYERVNPFEVRAIAGALVFNKSGEITDRRIFQALFENAFYSRNSSNSDAIILSTYVNSQIPEQSEIARNIISKNIEIDNAMRKLKNRATDAYDLLGYQRLITELTELENEAIKIGIKISLKAPNYDEIAKNLKSNEGFVHFDVSKFGIIVWGIDSKGKEFVYENLSELKSHLASPSFLQAYDILMDSFSSKSFVREHWNDLAYLVDEIVVGNGSKTSSVPYVNSQETITYEEILERTFSFHSENYFFFPVQKDEKLVSIFLPLIGRADTWTISHSDHLDGFPFAAIPIDSKEYFGTQFAYSITPSIQSFLVQRIRQNHRPTDIDFLGLGGIPFSRAPCRSFQSNNSLLKSTSKNLADEILHGQQCLVNSTEILTSFSKNYLKAVNLTNKNANELELFKFKNKKVGTLTFVTHGVTADINGAVQSSLLTYPITNTLDGIGDGLLTYEEIEKYSPVSDLVILSACRTAIPDKSLPEEAMSGLTRAFLLRGSKSILTTRWAVKLEFSELLAENFGKKSSIDDTPSKSMLRFRQMAKNKVGSSKWDWAGFELVGDGN